MTKVFSHMDRRDRSAMTATSGAKADSTRKKKSINRRTPVSARPFHLASLALIPQQD
jgi:hypothetical protein